MVLRVVVPPDLIGGDVDEGYGKVADAFRANFADGQEVGAAVAVYRDGVKVVDLWGGYRNGVTKTPWQRDTIVNLFSTTKGIAALTIAHAVSRQLLSYDARVSQYWPEFAQQGKGAVTVRQLLAHQAGLSALKPNPVLADIVDPARLAPILAAQKPAWPPGTRHGYHAITLGWYESELVRRTDPAARTLGATWPTKSPTDGVRPAHRLARLSGPRSHRLRAQLEAGGIFAAHEGDAARFPCRCVGSRRPDRPNRCRPRGCQPLRR